MLSPFIFSNGTYDGMLGDLVSGKIDFLPLGYTITTERLTSMDFIFSLTTDSAALFVKKESQDKIRWLLYFEPFSYSLWNALVVSSVIFTCLAIFQYLWASKFQSMSLLASVRFGLSVLWITFAVYFGRRLSRFPKHVLLKGTLFAGLFVGNFVFISYRASLTSTLSVPSPIVPFTTLKEFLMSDYRIIIPGGDSHEERLKTAKVTSEERAIWENKIEPGGDKNIAEDMKSAYDILRTNPKVALYHDILPLEALMTERERCEFIKAWISPSSTHISMVLAKHSPYTKIFSRALLKIVQEGMFQREEFKFSSQFSANCDQVTTVAEEVELGMSKICTGFFILLGGMALAVLTMMCELGTGGTRRYLFAELLEPEETKNTLMNQLEWLDRWIKFKSYEDEYQAIDLDDLEAKLDSISGSIMGARLMAKMLKKKKK